jgi:hypothetical protein
MADAEVGKLMEEFSSLTDQIGTAVVNDRFNRLLQQTMLDVIEINKTIDIYFLRFIQVLKYIDQGTKEFQLMFKEAEELISKLEDLCESTENKEIVQKVGGAIREANEATLEVDRVISDICRAVINHGEELGLALKDYMEESRNLFWRYNELASLIRTI